MNYRLFALCLVAVGCAQNPAPEGSLIENHGPTASEVKGLLRTAEGPFVQGQVETLTAVFDDAQVRSVRWSATAGALTSRDAKVSWTLPELEFAELTLTLTLNDGRELVTPFGFALVTPERENVHVARSAREALLATPMPVLDGGSEISGGACDLAYDGSANVHLAFTSGTHPAAYYGRWNGTAWTLEVMDTLGFNTGGRISPGQVHLRLDSAGNPHILYLRDDQVWYATKVGTGAWTRERVDTTTFPVNGTNNPMAIALNAAGRPSIIYETYVTSYDRVIFATRTAPNTWSTTMLSFTGIGTNYAARPEGDLLFDATTTAYFPAQLYGSSSGGYQSYLVSWNGTATEIKPVGTTLAPGWDLGSAKASSGVWASAGRALFRTSSGLYDFSIAAPLTNTTFTWSANESGGAGIGDLAWNGRPVMLHHHGSNLELVTPSSTGAAFWTWTQLGASSGVSASVAVHPSSGVPSICYQAGGRIMFQ